MKDSGNGAAAFETLEGGRSQVLGSLDFATVARLLPRGTAAIGGGLAAIIDLRGVTGSDSAGLALLIEWLSVAKQAGRTVRYENVPAQLHQLARLSDVDELVSGGAASSPQSTADGALR